MTVPRSAWGCSWQSEQPASSCPAALDGAPLPERAVFSEATQPVLGVEQAGRWLRNYLSVMTLELQTMARACGKSHVLNLEPEDMVALTVEAAAMAGVPLAGTDWIPGRI